MILATRTTMKTTLLFMQHSFVTQTRYISRPALSFGVAARRRNSIPSFNTSTLRLQLERSTKPALLLQTRAYSGKGKGKGKSKSFGNDLPSDDSLSEKDVALREALTQISSNFGKEAIMWLGRFNGSRNVPAISTGSVSLDVALGIGGLPKGRVVEIYGPEASGKTTLSLHVIAESQRNGGYCAFIDAEHALDPTLAESIGVDTNNLLLAQPDCGEQALSVVDTLVRCGSVDVVVIDSVAALVPKSELEGEMGDAHMALQARLMSQALRKLTPSLARSQTLVIFTNQIRHKLSTFGGSFGGPAEVTAGGNALKFYASVRLNVRRIGYIKKGDQVTGSQVLIKVVKNKLAPPLKTAELEIEFGRGISSEAEVLDLGCKQGLITKSGSFYTINEHRVHGKDAAKEYLKENEEVKYALYSEIKENLFHASNDNINGKEGDIENTDETASSPNTDISESDEVAETEIASVA